MGGLERLKCKALERHADKTVVISNKYGRFIMCDLTGVRAQIEREDGTYHMKHWVYKGNQGFMGQA